EREFGSRRIDDYRRAAVVNRHAVAIKVDRWHRKVIRAEAMARRPGAGDDIVTVALQHQVGDRPFDLRATLIGRRLLGHAFRGLAEAGRAVREALPDPRGLRGRVLDVI